MPLFIIHLKIFYLNYVLLAVYFKSILEALAPNSKPLREQF